MNGAAPVRITIDAGPDGTGYAIRIGEKVYPGWISSLAEALAHADRAKEMLKAEGVDTESYVSGGCIEANKNRDISARKMWNNPELRSKYLTAKGARP